MRLVPPAAALALTAALHAAAAAQPVVDPAWLWFPGALRHPSTAASAGVAMADRWLAEAPFDNPAIEPRNEVAVSPALVRVSRQDLRANNRNMDETPAFLDAAGGWVGARAGRFAVFGYADQPVLRLEASAFTEGRTESDPGLAPPPASVSLDLASREVRAGAGVSVGTGAWRIGAAGEWSHRDERTRVTVTSGAPTGNGTASDEISGDGVGAQVGARVTLPWLRPQGLTLGAAARWVPRLTMSGDTIAVSRQRAWEAGLSARARVSEALGLLAAFGGSGATAWEGLGASTGRSSGWAAAVEYHDADDPWTARLGVGQEQQNDVADGRAGRVGLGFGWAFGGSVLDVAVMRRNLERRAMPDSYDDRVLATLRVRF